MGLQGIQELMVLHPQPTGDQERQGVEAELPQLLAQGVQDGAGGGHPGQVGLVELVELEGEQGDGDGEHAVAEGLQPDGRHLTPGPRLTLGMVVRLHAGALLAGRWRCRHPMQLSP
jgi:hypothetical protein